MFSRLFKRTFWIFYDNLLKGIILNFSVFAVMFIAFFILFIELFLNRKVYGASQAAIITLGALSLIWHVLAPAVMHFWAKFITGTNEDMGMFARVGEGLKLFWLKGIALFAINTSFFFLAFLSINFYKSILDLGWWVYIVGGIGVWIVIMFLFIQIFLIPILVLDEKRRVLVSYKKALIMLLSAPFAASSVALIILYFNFVFYFVLHIGGSQVPTVLELITLFPLFMAPFITYTFIILLQVNFAILIYEKHKIMPSLKEVWEDGRNLSNLFKPWETKGK